ncbi:MAG: hypothetical protein Q9168_007369 [Polycauliona sp. 1 TL-2023]
MTRPRLSKSQALTKLEAIINALQPPRQPGPQIWHALDLTRQIFKDLQDQVPDLDIDQTCAALDRRRKYSRMAEREIWLPSLAELADKKEGEYPYVAVFRLQLEEQGYPEKCRYRQGRGREWSEALEEAFLRAVCDDLVDENGSLDFHWEPRGDSARQRSNRMLSDYLKRETGIELSEEQISSYKGKMKMYYWDDLKRLEALRNLDALDENHEMYDEEEESEDVSCSSMDEGYYLMGERCERGDMPSSMYQTDRLL